MITHGEHATSLENPMSDVQGASDRPKRHEFSGPTRLKVRREVGNKPRG